MNTAEAFITEFHNLEGITVAAKKRNFVNLLHHYASFQENDAVLNAITSQLTPKTHLEKIYYIDILIYFRRFQELWKLFLSGDRIVISKVSKQRWFYERIFQENCVDFVNTFLPTLSYSLRVKVLNQLICILNEQQSDDIFDALVNRYGVFVASKILPSCSCSKIEHALRNHPIKLWTSQLKLLYNKLPNLLVIYLEERVLHEGSSTFLNGDPIIRFIAMKNPEMFCYFQEKYKFEYCRIGKRTTKKIVQSKKHLVVAKPEVYIKNLNLACLVRKLGKDATEVYMKVFPKKLDDMFFVFGYDDAVRLLKQFPKKARFHILKNTFDQHFSNSLEEASLSITLRSYFSLLDMINHDKEREKWARMKFEHDRVDSYLQYFEASNCIAIIQPKLLNVFVPLTKRIEYVDIVTVSCLINRDWTALLTVCELLCSNLKNDDQLIHNRFVEVLLRQRYCQVFDSLSEVHWNYIKQIIALSENVNTSRLILKFLECAYKKDIIINENEIITLIKKTKWVDCLNNFKSEPGIERKILLLLIKIVPQIVDEENTVEKLDLCLIRYCKKHSSRCPEKFNVYEQPRLIQSLKDTLSRQEIVNNYEFAEAVDWLICVKNRSAEVETLTELYWDNIESLGTEKVVLWFLKNRPDIVAKNFEKFADVTGSGNFCCEYYYCVPKSSKVLKLIKCYDHLHITEKVVEHIMKKFRDGDFEEKLLFVKSLPLLLPAEDFIKLLENYIPAVPTVDHSKGEETAQFEFRRNLLKSCISVSESAKILSVILEYFRGDYVASCLSPLHSCLYRVPENRIKATLDRLCNIKAVSAKKHGFYFICVTQDESTIINSLKMCPLSQSIAMTFQHFVKNPTNPCWELLKHKLTILDNNDHFTCLVLVNEPLPKKYKAPFFEAAYEIFRSKHNKFTNVLVDKLKEETIGQLSSQFFDKLESNFLSIKRAEFLLACYMLRCSENTKFKVAFNILDAFKQHQWSFRSHEGREKIGQFISVLTTVYLDQQVADSSLMKNFAEGFFKIFPPVEVFEEFILLSLMQYTNQNRVDLAKSIVSFRNDLTLCYGKLIFNIFANCLNTVVKKLYPGEIEQLEFYSLLLEFKKSAEDVVLVINLLPKQRTQLKQSAQIYNNILHLLRQIKDETIQVHLHLYSQQQELQQ